jgi:hypothetical protein
MCMDLQMAEIASVQLQETQAGIWAGHRFTARPRLTWNRCGGKVLLEVAAT